jgi:hypothetical protein
MDSSSDLNLLFKSALSRPGEVWRKVLEDCIRNRWHVNPDLCLSDALQAGCLEAAKVVLTDFKVRPNVEWNVVFGETPLHMAVKLGGVEVVQLLTDQGASMTEVQQNLVAVVVPYFSTFKALLF